MIKLKELNVRIQLKLKESQKHLDKMHFVKQNSKRQMQVLTLFFTFHLMKCNWHLSFSIRNKNVNLVIKYCIHSLHKISLVTLDAPYISPYTNKISCKQMLL